MAKFTCPETPFGHYGFASYRIELDLSDPRRPMQRHIWRRASGKVEEQEWIPTYRADPEQLLKQGWKAI